MSQEMKQQPGHNHSHGHNHGSACGCGRDHGKKQTEFLSGKMKALLGALVIVIIIAAEIFFR